MREASGRPNLKPSASATVWEGFLPPRVPHTPYPRVANAPPPLRACAPIPQSNAHRNRRPTKTITMDPDGAGATSETTLMASAHAPWLAFVWVDGPPSLERASIAWGVTSPHLMIQLMPAAVGARTDG